MYWLSAVELVRVQATTAGGFGPEGCEYYAREAGGKTKGERERRSEGKKNTPPRRGDDEKIRLLNHCNTRITIVAFDAVLI